MVGMVGVLLLMPTFVAAQGHGHGGLVVDDAFVQVSHDKVPRFCNVDGAGAPIEGSTRSGDWSDPGVWSEGVVPGVDARVKISAGDTVTYDVTSDVRLDCIEVEEGGHLRFATNRSTKLVLDVLMVLPGGALTVGTAAAPIEAQATAEIVFRSDTPLDTGTVASPGIDPAQYGRGLLGFGVIEIHGRSLAQSYHRLAEEPLAGASTIELEASPSGWRVGDVLILPDTRQIPFRSNETYVSQAEEITIAAIDGSTVTLTAPLAHDHLGPRDAHGSVGVVELAMLPHVGNLTRNVILRSEDPSANDQRGHVQAFHRADVDIRYATFRDLGRTTIDDLDNTTFDENGAPTKIGTNQVGRYSLHLHHVWGPHNPTDTGYQLEVVGNVLWGMNKWGMTIHDTHYGLFRENVLYDGQGSALATEDGNEAYNVFERNFVVHTRAGDTEQILGHNPGRGGVFNTRALFGTTRDAFWFSGEYNYVRDNVAANVPDFAYNYNGYYLSQTMRVPRFRGANVLDPDEYEGWNYRGPGAAFVEGRDRREGLPVLESARNEAYGATGQGLWLTWARGCCSVSYYKQVSLFEDYKLWNLNHTGVYAFHESRNTYDGFILRGDTAISRLSGPNARFNRGFWLGTSAYENGQLVISDFDIQGYNIGIAMAPNLQDGTEEPNVALLQNGVLKNHVNVQEFLLSGTDDKQALLDNVHFEPVLAYESNRLPADPVNVFMSPSTDQNMRPTRPSQLFVHDWNGEEGNSFQIYWVEQAPGAVVLPPARPDLHAGNPDVSCPEQGLTNQQCWDQYGVALAGAVAPCVQVDGDDCAAARARAAALGITGLHFPLDVPPPPAVCGNGVVESGETCDDGNTSDGDCCSSSCAPEPVGAACDDGVVCTVDACDSAGACVGTAGPAACGVAEKTSLVLNDRDRDAKDALVWDWIATGPPSSFGDPATGSTGFTLCVLDQSGSRWDLAATLEVPAGGTCGRRDCWRALGPRGFVYRDADRTSDGVKLLRLENRASGRTKMVLKAVGESVPLPGLPLDQNQAVAAQLWSSDGVCWGSTFDAPARRNDATQFRDTEE